jgi:uncharacterized protein (DUF885 family)
VFRNHFAAAMFVALALTCGAARGDETPPASPSPVATQNETPVPKPGDAALAVVAERWYAGLWKFNPSNATSIGVHDYDAALDPVTPDAIAAEIKREHVALAAVRRIDDSTLTLDGQTDKFLLETGSERSLWSLEERPDWRLRPGYYSDIAAGGVYAILERKFAPLDKRLALVIARERQIPELLAQGEKNLDIPKIAHDIAVANLEDAQGSVAFFQSDVPSAFAAVKDPQLRAQFAASNAAVIKAFSEYVSFMKNKVLPAAHGSYAIGAAAYSKLERYQNVVDIPLPQLLAVGEANLAANRAAFIATARLIDPHKTPQQVIALNQLDHPRADQLLATAQAQLAGLAAMLKDKHIIDLPPAPLAKVVKTPQFQAQTSFASMDSPGPLETKATEAYYNVTVPDSHWTAQQTEQYLRALNRVNLAIISSHEAYPGHYTNYLFNKTHDLSLIRKIEWNVAFGEGWAHYDEQMMVDEGLGNGDPRYRLAQLQEALWRNARFVIGIKEHTQGMTVEQATDLFMRNVFVERQVAYREALRGTQDPLYGYYTLGKLMILKLRADYQKKMGAAYSLNAFHDAFLSHGDPPIYFARKFLLGADDAGPLL